MREREQLARMQPFVSHAERECIGLHHAWTPLASTPIHWTLTHFNCCIEESQIMPFAHADTGEAEHKRNATLCHYRRKRSIRQAGAGTRTCPSLVANPVVLFLSCLDAALMPALMDTYLSMVCQRTMSSIQCLFDTVNV